jgi:hypothetical protein
VTAFRLLHTPMRKILATLTLLLLAGCTLAPSLMVIKEQKVDRKIGWPQRLQSLRRDVSGCGHGIRQARHLGLGP